MKRFAILLFILAFSINANNTFARQFRVGQLPNGSKFQCANCHVSPGGPRNEFGKAVQNGFLDGSGKVVWGPELASLDSDGDGFSNGQELGDPEGSWSVGKPNPGDASNLGNPGDKNSFPTTAFVFDAGEIPWFAEISSLEVNPNPVSYISSLNINMKENAFLKVDIVGTDGKYIGSLFNGFATAGNMSINLNMSRLNIGSGMYVIYATSGNTSVVKKISVVR